MIYDKLTNINLYKGIHPNLDVAIDYITSHDLTTMEVGKYEILGTDVNLSVMEKESKDIATTPFELHKKYLDIHIDITGCEIIETGDMGDVTDEVFDEVKDFGTVKCSTKVVNYLAPGDFYICMLDEPHKPLCAVDEKILVKKCVFKVLV